MSEQEAEGEGFPDVPVAAAVEHQKQQQEE